MAGACAWDPYLAPFFAFATFLALGAGGSWGSWVALEGVNLRFLGVFFGGPGTAVVSEAFANPESSRSMAGEVSSAEDDGDKVLFVATFLALGIFLQDFLRCSFLTGWVFEKFYAFEKEGADRERK